MSAVPKLALALKQLGYADLQQCMHCGMCLPTCPTYTATLNERQSPRGRIALMRAVADERIEATPAFAEEMYNCLGCLACQTACPAGVGYGSLLETARAEVEEKGLLATPRRSLVRWFLIRLVFTRPRLLRLVGRSIRLWTASGGKKLFRALGLPRLLPKYLRDLEAQTPEGRAQFSDALIAAVEKPEGIPRHRVGLLTGCVQDLLYSEINRDTAEVLLANGCEVHTPRLQPCCGSLHAHNGDIEAAKGLAKRLIDLFPLEGENALDAVLSNAGGCGSHLKEYGHLLSDDPAYAAKAALWSKKFKDIHAWLAETGIRPPKMETEGPPCRVTYHDSCHLCHGQKIAKEPRALLKGIPGLELVDLPEASWCCGSAGVYNITRPEMAASLRDRKIGHIAETGATVVALANPGCHIQVENGARLRGLHVEVAHPLSLLARAYRRERGDAKL